MSDEGAQLDPREQVETTVVLPRREFDNLAAVAATYEWPLSRLLRRACWLSGHLPMLGDRPEDLFIAGVDDADDFDDEWD